MIFPAAFGFSCWVLLGNFSAIYGIVNVVWCLVFVEYWKRQEQELSIRWGVKNVSVIQEKRRDFKPDTMIRDTVTGEDVPHFSGKKRLQRQLLQIPLALLCVVGLGTIIVTCYSIEIFISEVYNGPFKSVLTFTPVVLLTLSIPPTSTFLTSFAEKLTAYENYETQDAHDKAMTSKVFVINFLTSYTAIFLTAFVYVPFATILVPYLDVFSLTVKPFAENDAQIKAPTSESFSINPNRLKNQMIYFAVTAQVVNFATETILPLVTQKGKQKYNEMQASRAERHGGTSPTPDANDTPEERDFLRRVRQEAALPCYDVTSDLREMCIQFGYLSLFSSVWPLTPVSYFINNWIELRGDTFKLTTECRRPNPERADSIGPWLSSLEFLAWLGSVTTAAVCYMFSGSADPEKGGLGPDGRPHQIKGWALLLCIFFSEHIFLVARLAVRTAFSKLDSVNMRKERSERFMVRRKYLEEAGLSDAVKPLGSGNEKLSTNATRALINEKGDADVLGDITRSSLEEDARQESLTETNMEPAARRFWGRQRTWRESEKVGLHLLEELEWGVAEGKKSK
jgi:anoctamin-10